MKKFINILTMIMKYLLFFCLGGFIYYCVELIYRGHSHPSMYIVGGLCFILIGIINEVFSWKMFIELQIIIGDLAVLLLEFISGCIVNLWLGLNVWDYSSMPYNILGQVCLTFAFLWIPLVLFAILLDDWLRYRLLGENKPEYHSAIVRFINWIKRKIVK